MDKNKNGILLILTGLIILIALILFYFNNYNVQGEFEESDYSAFSTTQIASLKASLIKDPEFTKFIMMDFSLQNNPKTLVKVLLNNLDHRVLTVTNQEYKILRQDLDQAYLELYGVELDLTNLTDPSLQIREQNGEVYFTLDVAAANDNLVFIGIKTLNVVNKNTLGANVDIYEMYVNDPELEAKATIEIEASLTQHDYVTKDLTDKYNMMVNTKTIVFREELGNKYFKYQFISDTYQPELGFGEFDDNGYLGIRTLVTIYIIVGILAAIGSVGIYYKIKNSNR